MGTIIRTANAFNINKVHIIGRKQWNKRGAMVTDLYMNIEYHTDAGAFFQASRGKALIAVDIVPGATPLSKADLPRNSILVFGAEGPGLSQEMLEAADQTIMVEQFGSTRSVNVGVAAGVVMYAWVSKYGIIKV